MDYLLENFYTFITLLLCDRRVVVVTLVLAPLELILGKYRVVIKVICYDHSVNDET